MQRRKWRRKVKRWKRRRKMKRWKRRRKKMITSKERIIVTIVIIITFSKIEC